MSALVAVRLAAPGPVSEILHTALSSMPYRSPDGSATYLEPRCGLAFGFKRVLAEDSPTAEVHQNDSISLICDVRLDNRHELIEMLNLGGGLISDSEILFQAYVTWGMDCAHRLLGDFAFVAHHTGAKRIVACRDHMGVKPLFWRLQDGNLLISSEMRPLLSPGVPFLKLTTEEIIPQQLADFITGRVTEDNQVFFKDIMRVPPGHYLISDVEGEIALKNYWRPELKTLPNNEDFVQSFKARLFEAVKCRLRAARPVVSLLSGGLDSSSLTAIAGELLLDCGDPPIEAYSIVFDQVRGISEREYMEAVLASSHVQGNFIDLSYYRPLEGLEQLIETQGRPVPAPGIKMKTLLMKRIASDGHNVFLDGNGGDEVISHGFGRLPELAGSGKWLSVWQELKGHSGLYGESRIHAMFMIVLQYARFKGANKLRKFFRTVYKRREAKTTTDLLGPTLRPFKDSLSSRPRQLTESLQHLDFLRSSMRALTLEVIELTAAAAGLEARLPFFDKRVVEYSLRLPSEEKLSKGWIRYVLRRAMAGVLPEKVQWRRSKFDFTPHILAGMIKGDLPDIKKVIFDDVDGVGAYVDLTKVREALSRVMSRNSKTVGVDVQIIWRTVTLSLWLRQMQKSVAL